MRLTVDELKAAVVEFERRILGTMSKNANKFAGGVAFALVNKSIDALAESAKDKDGLIDMDALKALVDAGLDASGGSLVASPKIHPMLRSMLGIDVETKITRADFDEFFTETVAKYAMERGPSHA